MYKLFSVAQANKLIPQVDEKLRHMQQAAKDLANLQHFLYEHQPTGARALNTIQEMRFLGGVCEDYAREIHAMGAHLKDLEQGHVVFPGQVGAEVVALCWEQGDDAIRYYQRVNHEEKYALPDMANPVGRPATPRA